MVGFEHKHVKHYNVHINHVTGDYEYYARIVFVPITLLNTWWRHQMETISALLALCAGNSPVPVNSPHKGQWRGALMFTLICARINGWVKNREAGDLRRYRAHYDVIVMRLGSDHAYISQSPESILVSVIAIFHNDGLLYHNTTRSNINTSQMVF